MHTTHAPAMVCVFFWCCISHHLLAWGAGLHAEPVAQKGKRKKEKKKSTQKTKSVGEIYHCHRDFGDRRGHEVTVYEPGGDG